MRRPATSRVSLAKQDTSPSPSWFQSQVNWFKSFFRPQQISEIASVSSVASSSSPFGRGGQKRMYSTMPVPSGGESKVKISQNELIESTSKAYVVPATSKPGWLSGRAAKQTYEYFLEAMNTLKKGEKIGFITILRLVRHIQESNYNPINIPDETGHSFYYYLLQNFKNENRDDSDAFKNDIKQDIRHCKSLGAELNEFDRQEMSKNIQNDLDRLATAIKNEDLAAIYDIACGLQVYDFAGLDNISTAINKDNMNEYIAECRKDPSLFKKLVEYGNVVKSYQKYSEPYSRPERHYQSIADKMLQDYNKYQAFLPMYSFDKTFDMDKPLEIGVRILRGQGTTIKSKKSMGEMIARGELLDYIQEDVFKNSVVKQAVDNYAWWNFSRTEARVMGAFEKEEDHFYGRRREAYAYDTGRRIIDFPGYNELKELLKQDIQNKIAHLQRLHEVFFDLAKSMKSGNSLMDNFNTMYNDLVSFDDVYTPNELVFKDLIQQYHPDKLKLKVEAGEISEKDANTIKEKIAKLTGMRTTYQKEQLAKE